MRLNVLFEQSSRLSEQTNNDDGLGGQSMEKDRQTIQTARKIAQTLLQNI